MVEHELPKLGVEGSNPFARSNFAPASKRGPGRFFAAASIFSAVISPCRAREDSLVCVCGGGSVLSQDDLIETIGYFVEESREALD